MKLPDIDIDVQNREELLKYFEHVPAYSKKTGKHIVGVYFQNIPLNPLEGFSTIDYNEADSLGYFKIDILNNSVYSEILSNDEIDSLLDKEIYWELLHEKEITDQLSHVNGYEKLLKNLNPTSIEELAMCLALIRPGKKHLIGKSFIDIKDEIWKKPTDGSFAFKKSHAIAYAVSIVMQLNFIVEKLDKK